MFGKYSGTKLRRSAHTPSKADFEMLDQVSPFVFGTGTKSSSGKEHADLDPQPHQEARERGQGSPQLLSHPYLKQGIASNECPHGIGRPSFHQAREHQ